VGGRREEGGGRREEGGGRREEGGGRRGRSERSGGIVGAATQGAGWIHTVVTALGDATCMAVPSSV
jgi:hypothetical protein